MLPGPSKQGRSTSSGPAVPSFHSKGSGHRSCWTFHHGGARALQSWTRLDTVCQTCSMDATPVRSPELDEILAQAASQCAQSLERSNGRPMAKGPLEHQEFAPAMANALEDSFLARNEAVEVVTDLTLSNIPNWSAKSSQVDMVVRRKPDQEIILVGELKCWDIGHQIFDLLKVACLLEGGASAGFLGVIAKHRSDFATMPGGELFASNPGQRTSHDVLALLERHQPEVRKHFGCGGPEPTAAPIDIETVAIGEPLPVAAYKGHELRLCLVEIPVDERIGLPQKRLAP